MSNYLTPGLYIKEVNPNTPVQGVSTSVAGFIGIVPRGARGKAVMVTSWSDYVNKFAFGLSSPFLSNSYLSYAVYGFFLNGGSRCYIAGVADSNLASATYSYLDDSNVSVITINAADAGAWGNSITTKLTTNANAGFDLEVKYNGTLVSKYIGITLDSTDTSNFAELAINGVDRYITVDVESTATIKAASLGTFQSLVSGNSGTSSLANADYTEAFAYFDNVDDLNILVVPDSQADAVITEGLAYADNRKDCLFIFDAQATDDATGVIATRNKFNGGYGAMYYPWIKVSDPISTNPVDKTKYVPVCGHVAGAMARTDNERSVYKAPAGTKAILYGALGTKYSINDATQETLNPIGVNCIRIFKNEGAVIWGARCLDNTYVNIRRGLNYIKTSLKRGLRWVVFEPNNNILWNKMKASIDSFLRSEYKNNRDGFKGETPDESFFVKCDGELNTSDTIKIGQVKAQVGVAIAEPGEFVVIEIGQWDGGSSAEELG